MDLHTHTNKNTVHMSYNKYPRELLHFQKRSNNVLLAELQQGVKRKEIFIKALKRQEGLVQHSCSLHHGNSFSQDRDNLKGRNVYEYPRKSFKEFCVTASVGQKNRKETEHTV